MQANTDLLERARDARTHAYAPYSHFAVGAAVQASDGRVFVGANVENASLGLTTCAERAAICAAVNAGVREIVAVAIAGPAGTQTAPCGACRQVIAEFAAPQTPITFDGQGAPVQMTLADLLPLAFGPSVVHQVRGAQP